MRGARLVGMVAVLAMVLTGCGTADPEPGRPTGPASSAAATPPAANNTATVTPAATATPTPTPEPAPSPPSGCMMIVDWVDFVQIAGVTYTRIYPFEGRPVEAGETLGEPYAVVTSNPGDSTCDAPYQARDGDAAFLAPGTQLYTVAGYAPTFRLGVREDDRLVIYQAESNQHAITGRDVFDIQGKVRSIDVLDWYGTMLGTIDDPDQVAALVDLLMPAPVEPGRVPDALPDPTYLVTFWLADGTTVPRGYIPSLSLFFQSGLVAPDAFREAIEAVAREARANATPEPLPEQVNPLVLFELDRATGIYLKDAAGVHPIDDWAAKQAIAVALNQELRVSTPVPFPATGAGWQQGVVVGFTMPSGSFVTFWYDRTTGTLTSQDAPSGALGLEAPEGFGALVDEMLR